MIRGSRNETIINSNYRHSIVDVTSHYGNAREKIMGKGDTPRPCSTTREEQDLRWRYATTDMTRTQFDIEFKKLMEQGLIKRDGRIIR